MEMNIFIHTSFKVNQQKNIFKRVYDYNIIS